MSDKIVYTDEQQRAIQRAVEVLGTRKHRVIMLVGAGGMGKTTTVGEAVHTLLRQGKRVLITAPTNKAVRVIRAATLEALSHYKDISLDNVEFMTIHKSLGLATLPVEDTKYTAQTGEPRLHSFDAMVVDEASMVGQKALNKYLLPAMQAVSIPALFMGDAHQLPPPKEAVSPAFAMFLKDASKLTKPMRQRPNSGIYKMASNLRGCIDIGTPFKFSQEQFSGEDVIIHPGPSFRKKIIEHFKNDPDTTRSRVLAWRNDAVSRHNRLIREALYGEDVPPYVVGERVVIGDPVIRDRQVVLSTDEECVVASVNPGAYLMDEATGEDYRVIRMALKPCETPGAAAVVVNVLDESENKRVDNTLERYAGSKNWPRFWALKELFDDVRYTYCITVHRSQGSTYDHVFVDADDILRNKKQSERQRLLYVAFTRPRQTLKVNKIKFIA